MYCRPVKRLKKKNCSPFCPEIQKKEELSIGGGFFGKFTSSRYTVSQARNTLFMSAPATQTFIHKLFLFIIHGFKLICQLSSCILWKINHLSISLIPFFVYRFIKVDLHQFVESQRIYLFLFFYALSFLLDGLTFFCFSHFRRQLSYFARQSTFNKVICIHIY